MTEEKWVTIQEAIDYEVSNFGRIRSYKYKTPRILKQKLNKIGYYQIGLCVGGGKRKFFLVHRLVLSNFSQVENMKELEVNHINENKQDNRLENLEWLTSKENCNHGTRNKRIGEFSSNKVLCVETGVVYNSQLEASIETNTSESGISNCLNGKRRKANNLHWRKAV